MPSGFLFGGKGASSIPVIAPGAGWNGTVGSGSTQPPALSTTLQGSGWPYMAVGRIDEFPRIWVESAGLQVCVGAAVNDPGGIAQVNVYCESSTPTVLTTQAVSNRGSQGFLFSPQSRPGQNGDALYVIDAVPVNGYIQRSTWQCTLNTDAGTAISRGVRYVDYSTGNDANDGLTPATAWKTLNMATANVPDGGIIYYAGNASHGGGAVYLEDVQTATVNSVARMVDIRPLIANDTATIGRTGTKSCNAQDVDSQVQIRTLLTSIEGMTIDYSSVQTVNAPNNGFCLFKRCKLIDPNGVLGPRYTWATNQAPEYIGFQNRGAYYGWAESTFQSPIGPNSPFVRNVSGTLSWDAYSLGVFFTGFNDFTSQEGGITSFNYNVYQPTGFFNRGSNETTLIVNSAAYNGTNSAITLRGAVAGAISTMTWSGGTVTVTTTSPHGFANGLTIYVGIAGVTPTGYNSGGNSYVSTITGASTFTFALASNPGVVTIQGNYTTPIFQKNSQGLIAIDTSTAFPRLDVVGLSSSNALSDGTGKVVVQVASTASLATNNTVFIQEVRGTEAVVGTNQANGIFTITVVDGTHFELTKRGLTTSTFPSNYLNGWVSGGRVYRTFGYGGLYDNGTAAQTQTITGAVNNGSGLIRLTVASTAYFATGQQLLVAGVLGTTEANGVWTVTRFSATQIDLQGSTFVNTWSSGGTQTIKPNNPTINVLGDCSSLANGDIIWAGIESHADANQWLLSVTAAPNPTNCYFQRYKFTGYGFQAALYQVGQFSLPTFSTSGTTVTFASVETLRKDDFITLTSGSQIDEYRRVAADINGSTTCALVTPFSANQSAGTTGQQIKSVTNTALVNCVFDLMGDTANQGQMQNGTVNVFYLQCTINNIQFNFRNATTNSKNFGTEAFGGRDTIWGALASDTVTFPVTAAVDGCHFQSGTARGTHSGGPSAVTFDSTDYAGPGGVYTPTSGVTLTVQGKNGTGVPLHPFNYYGTRKLNNCLVGAV